MSEMPTLVINAPKRKIPSAEIMIEESKAPGYAMWRKFLDVVYDSSTETVRQGCGLVLLCRDGNYVGKGSLLDSNEQTGMLTEYGDMTFICKE